VTTYKAPATDSLFVLDDLLGVPSRKDLPGFEDLSRDTLADLPVWLPME
jgi:hypothetical protein